MDACTYTLTLENLFPTPPTHYRPKRKGTTHNVMYRARRIITKARGGESLRGRPGLARRATSLCLTIDFIMRRLYYCVSRRRNRWPSREASFAAGRWRAVTRESGLMCMRKKRWAIGIFMSRWLAFRGRDRGPSLVDHRMEEEGCENWDCWGLWRLKGFTAVVIGIFLRILAIWFNWLYRLLM